MTYGRRLKVIYKKLVYGIRAITPKTLREFMYRLGMFFGSSLVQSYPSIEGTLTYLREWGCRPSVAIDVGAYHGEWTRMFKRIFPACKVLMVEGQAGKEETLAKVCAEYGRDVACVFSVLGAKNGEKVRFVEMETGSSVFEESSPYVRCYVDRHLETLDSVLERYPEFCAVDFIKLDVQGFELEVLKGASRILSNTELVLMEASLIPINRGCPLISDVIQFMVERGFRLLDFCSQTRRQDSALWQTDLLFVNSSSKLMPAPALE